MTKHQLLLRLQGIPDDAIITIVDRHHGVNDVKEIIEMPSGPHLRRHEVYLYPTPGRQCP